MATAGHYNLDVHFKPGYVPFNLGSAFEKSFGGWAVPIMATAGKVTALQAVGQVVDGFFSWWIEVSDGR